jgi:G3E family GTPase
VVETTGIADSRPIANALVLDALLRASFASPRSHDGRALHATRQLTRSRKRCARSLADVLIVTKTDLAAPEAVAALAMRLEELNRRREGDRSAR